MRRALAVFLLISLVSLFADIAYEGARSISGVYLEVLGATLVIAGGISVGELISYAARFLGGLIAFKIASSRAYWILLILGYTVNLIAVPLLALAGSWELAFTLYIVERVGKGLRVPIRDTILAEVSRGVGSGKVFAVHELLDQIGGVIGPLIVAYSLSRTDSYSLTFATLALPAVIAVTLIIVASMVYPVIRSARRTELPISIGLSLEFKLFTIAIALAMASYIHWGQASYILSQLGGFNVALLYAIAMAFDGIASIPLGLAFDKWGSRVTLLIPLLTLTSTILLLEIPNPLLFTLTWGITMGALEVLPKAVTAELVREEYRSIAYSLLFISMGTGWTAGNILLACIGPESQGAILVVVMPALISTIILARIAR